jgi:hypothetical protein
VPTIESTTDSDSEESGGLWMAGCLGFDGGICDSLLGEYYTYKSSEFLEIRE